MPSYPDFIAAKRAQAPNMAQAAWVESQAEQNKYAADKEKFDQMTNLPFRAYQGYTDLTDTNPLADAVRGWTGKGGGDGTAGGGLNKMGPGSGGRGATVPHPTGSGLPGTTNAVNQAASLGGMPGGTANAPTHMQGGQQMLTGGGGNPVALPTSNVIPQQAAQQASTMLADTGAKAGSEVAGKMGSAAMGAAGGAVTGGALSGLMESQNPHTNDERIGVKTAGGASTGALMASAAPLAAAGPVGWAAIAGMAAMSLYGMLV